MSGPEVISRGCFFAGDDALGNPAEQVKQIVEEELVKNDCATASIATIKTCMQRCIKKYFRVTLKRNPVVLPIVMEVE